MREILDQAHHILSLKMTVSSVIKLHKTTKGKEDMRYFVSELLDVHFNAMTNMKTKLMYNKINNDEKNSSLQSNGSL